MSALFNEMLFLIPAILLLVVLITFLLIAFIKNSQLRQIVREYSDFYASRDFIIKIDTSIPNWRIVIHNRKKEKGQAKTVLSEFRQTIFKMDQGVFETYVANCGKDKKLPKLVVRHTSGPYTLKTTKGFRREYIPLKRVGDKVFFKCQEFTTERVKNQKNVLGNLAQFKKNLKGLVSDNLQIQGALFAVSIMNLEQILSRYNVGITSLYREHINNRISSFCSGTSMICGKDDDLYLIYSNRVHQRKEAIALFRDLKMALEAPITLSGFKLPVQVNCGLAFVGEFSFNIDTLVDQAIQALDEAIRGGHVIDFFIYDAALEQDNQKRKKNYEKIGRIISSRSFSPMYAPVISVETLKTIGYRISFTPDSYFLTLKEISELAQEINLTEKLNDSLATTVLSHFYFKKDINNDIIFIETTFEQARQYVAAYRQNMDYSEITMALVLTDYQVFRHRQLDTALIEQIKRNNILIYAQAHPDMLISDHPIFTYLDGIVFTQEILVLSEKDQLYKLEMIKINDRFEDYNYNYVAFDIDNSQKFEIVNSLGIRFIEGNLVRTPDPNPYAFDGANFKKRLGKGFRK